MICDLEWRAFFNKLKYISKGEAYHLTFSRVGSCFSTNWSNIILLAAHSKNYIYIYIYILYCTVGCEPIGELSTAAVLADLYDRELVLTISWAKQVTRRTYLTEQKRTCRPENYVELSPSNVSLPSGWSSTVSGSIHSPTPRLWSGQYLNYCAGPWD